MRTRRGGAISTRPLPRRPRARPPVGLLGLMTTTRGCSKVIGLDVLEVRFNRWTRRTWWTGVPPARGDGAGPQRVVERGGSSSIKAVKHHRDEFGDTVPMKNVLVLGVARRRGTGRCATAVQAGRCRSCRVALGVGQVHRCRRRSPGASKPKGAVLPMLSLRIQASALEPLGLDDWPSRR